MRDHSSAGAASKLWPPAQPPATSATPSSTPSSRRRLLDGRPRGLGVGEVGLDSDEPVAGARGVLERAPLRRAPVADRDARSLLEQQLHHRAAEGSRAPGDERTARSAHALLLELLPRVARLGAAARGQSLRSPARVHRRGADEARLLQREVREAGLLEEGDRLDRAAGAAAADDEPRVLREAPLDDREEVRVGLAAARAHVDERHVVGAFGVSLVELGHRADVEVRVALARA